MIPFACTIGGVVAGWWLRGTLDRILTIAIIRILCGSAGKARILRVLANAIAKFDAKDAVDG